MNNDEMQIWTNKCSENIGRIQGGQRQKKEEDNDEDKEEDYEDDAVIAALVYRGDLQEWRAGD